VRHFTRAISIAPAAQVPLGRSRAPARQKRWVNAAGHGRLAHLGATPAAQGAGSISPPG